jgi:eukaryotic-like serine/threonine-protein kinase
LEVLRGGQFNSKIVQSEFKQSSKTLMSVRRKRIYEFGAYRLDESERTLWRDGQALPLPAKAFDTLLLLVGESGHLLEKDELMRRLWPDTFVEEANLTNNISLLRKALASDAAESSYIETVPRRGYRFVGGVRELDDEEGELVVERHTLASLSIEEEHEDRAIEADRILLPAIQRRRWVNRKIATGLALIAVLAVIAIATQMYLKSMRAPRLTDKDTVLIADFTNTTGDTVFDDSLKRALAVQLEQSPFLNIFAEERVRQALRFMARSPDERITREIAKEICERQGIKAMLTGSIAPLGSHYVINLEATNAHTGDVIARQQVETESKEQVLQTLGKAAAQLREKLGESLASIQKFDAPIEQATTASLEALKAYSLGRGQSLGAKHREAIPFYERAVELDANFASAYTELAVAYSQTGQNALSARFAESAFELREHASEYEKFRISWVYYVYATGEVDKVNEVGEVWKQAYPRDYVAHNSLAFYRLTGQFENAVNAASEAIRLDADRPPGYVNLGYALMGLNRFDEARETYERALARNLNGRYLHDGLYAVAFVRSDSGAMQQQMDWYAGRPDEYMVSGWQARAAAFAGQLRRASELSHRAADLAAGRDLKEVAAGFVMETALRAALFGQCQSVAAETAEALARSRKDRSFFDNIGSPSIPSGALALALCGETGQAQSLADELSRQYPKATMINAIFLPVIRAAIELQRNRPDQAIQLLQSANPYEGAARFWPGYLRGQAYLRLQKGTEAAAEFQKILDHRGWDPLSPFYPLAYVGLARAEARLGDTAKSRKAYKEFFALWKDADPGIPILQQAGSEYEKLKRQS